MNHLVRWSEQLETGLPEIDTQHRALVDLLNELHEAVHRRRGVEACRGIVERLRQCALAHRDTEGRLLIAAGASGDLHAQQDLVDQLDRIRWDMDETSSNISFLRLHEFKSNVLAHIRDTHSAVGVDGNEDVSGRRVFSLLRKRA